MPKAHDDSGQCRFCPPGDEDRICYDHCPESKDGEHAPDKSSLEVTHAQADVHLDVWCANCGLSTGVQVDLTDLTWS